LLDDLRAFVEFALAGSIAGAADRLFRTPSAVTRQVQRLEAALGAELLDRSTMQESPTSVYSTLEHVAAWARDGVDQEKAVRILSNESVKVHTLARDYCGLPSRAGLIFGYGRGRSARGHARSNCSTKRAEPMKREGHLAAARYD